MKLLGGLASGLIAGLLGALVWVAIVYFTGFEIGFVAWGLGFVVGLFVHLGSPENEGPGQGVLAAIIAVGSILLAKGIIYYVFVVIPFQQTDDLFEISDISDDMLISQLADKNVEEIINDGGTINWPPGVNQENASIEEDYPADIWEQATTDWNNLGADEKQAKRNECLETLRDSNREIMKLMQPGFLEMFDFMDLLWFGLAIFTAFKAGAGGYGD